jgi:hypothetical protein
MSNVNTRITFLDNGHDACCKLSADAGMKEEFEKVSAKNKKSKVSVVVATEITCIIATSRKRNEMKKKDEQLK